MLNTSIRTRIVEAIEQVYINRRPLELLTKTYPDIGIEDAYRIQEEYVARKLASGSRLKGYKVGLTSKVMQDLAGSKEPDFGALLDHMFLPEDTPLAFERFLTPMAEVEIAIVLKDHLQGPGVLPVDVVRATDFVLPALEIVDFRVAAAPGMTIVDTVADLAGCGAVVLGANPRRLDQLELRTVNGKVSKNGTPIVAGQASAVLGNPINSAAWLANKLAQFGVAFEPGQIILTGSFVRAFPVTCGDEIKCLFDQGLGELVARFT